MLVTNRRSADNGSMYQHTSAADQQLNKLIAFRQAAYAALGRARDALFELTDALLLSPNLPSLAHLSCCPVFRRRWPSVYEALQDGNTDPMALLRLYLQHVSPTPAIYPQPRLIIALDHTTWSMPYSRTMPQRGYWHQPQPLPTGRPITVGHGYSSLAWIPELQGSWALPLLQQRIAIDEKPIQKAAEQLRSFATQLPAGLAPLALLDSGYGGPRFLCASGDIAIDKIIRLRPNLRLYRAPPAYSGKGRPRKHGPAFNLKQPATWGEADEIVCTQDSKAQPVRVELWRNLHFGGAAQISLDVARISRQATRAAIKGREVKPQWLAWVGAGGVAAPPLAEWWWLYGRRYPLEHWYRLAKGGLHWLLPQLGTPKACETWSQLVVLASWQLWLGRQLGEQVRLPWQKAHASGARTPGRVRQGLGGVMAAIGTPAQAPKPRGKSPGWPAGKQRRPREEQAVVHKGHARRKRSSSDAARAPN